MLKQGVDASNFGLTSYTDKSNRKQRCYQLTYKGVLILASGYNPVLREKIINRWEELETGNAEPKYAQQTTSQSKLSDKIQAANFHSTFAITISAEDYNRWQWIIPKKETDYNSLLKE